MDMSECTRLFLDASILEQNYKALYNDEADNNHEWVDKFESTIIEHIKHKFN
jgi:hypothetical protein